MKSRNAFRKAIIISSSSLVYFIIYGIVRLNAQLFLAVRERFGADREEASLPFILVYAVSNVFGPFIGFLGEKFGLRCTTVFGCLLSSVSIAACFLVEDIKLFTILWGIGFGIGFGLGTALIPNILHLYFTKTFNLMQGIFNAAGSTSSFLLPGIVEYILDTYGTSGTFLIVSGLVLNSVPAAMLLKCPEKTPKIKCHVEVKRTSELFTIAKARKTSETENVPKSVCRSNSEEVDSTELCRCQNIKRGVVIDISRLSNNVEMCQRCSCGKISSLNGTLEKSIAYTYKKKMKDAINICNFESDYTRQKNYQFDSPDNILSKHKKAEISQDVPFERKKYSAEHKTENNFVFKGNNPYAMERLEYTSMKFNKYPVTKLSREYNFLFPNLQVFFDLAYILILISLTFAMIPITDLTTVMVDACRDKGVSKDVTILMTFASADVIGRLVFGYLADLKCTSPLNIYALNCGLYGLLLIGFKWVNEFYSVVVFFVFLGFLMGGIVITPAGVIRDYIEKENLTMAYSSRYFLLGLLNLSQPSVIGYFRETLQSYDGLFYSLGSMCIFGAVVALFVPTAARYRDRKKETVKSLG